MRAGRLLELLLLLQARGRMTATELAGELEVSVRTVYRDVEALSAAGVPVYADRGPAGGYRLLAGYRTKLTGLTSDEAVSLFLAGLPGPAAELGMGAVLAGAQLKLLAALPAELRERAAHMRELFHLDAPGWFRDPEPIPFLTEIGDAVWERRRVRAEHLTAPAVRRAIEETAGEPDAAGWVRATVPIESIRHGMVDLLKLGPDLEVLDPPELRAAVIDRIDALTRLYTRPPD